MSGDQRADQRDGRRRQLPPPTSAPTRPSSSPVPQRHSAFFGVLEALRQDSLTKILAEPNLVTISGRPAYVFVGGAFGYHDRATSTGTTVEFKDYGTRLDFVPIVLGNGRIRLEVRPSVSERDDCQRRRQGIPALRTREAETGVELRAGQTLAIAGLVQQRIEASNTACPGSARCPTSGAPVPHGPAHQTNEVELLILVTPGAGRCHGRQPGAALRAGHGNGRPQRLGAVLQGHLEVPDCCPDGAGGVRRPVRPAAAAMPGPRQSGRGQPATQRRRPAVRPADATPARPRTPSPSRNGPAQRNRLFSAPPATMYRPATTRPHAGRGIAEQLRAAPYAGPHRTMAC